MQDGLGNAGALSHSLTKRAKSLLVVSCEIQESQYLPDPSLWVANSRQAREKGEIFGKCEVVVELHVLGKVANGPADGVRIGADVVTADDRRARRRLQQRGEDADGCGLPCAVVTEKPKNLAAVHLEVEFIEGLMLAVPFYQCRGFDRYIRHSSEATPGRIRGT